MDSKTKAFFKELIPYVIILIVVVLIRSYIVTPVKVSGQSMYPTLKGTEVMILNKLDKKYERYDIVVVKSSDGDIIKRVYGLPGETISCEGGNIYINGKKIDDDFGHGKTMDFKKVELKDDEYFVLGDNRMNSKDSRIFGPFTEKEIKGKTKLVIFPFNKIGNVK
jgi:signal peptidase I